MKKKAKFQGESPVAPVINPAPWPLIKKKEGISYIYAIAHPRSKVILYVGKTNDLPKRARSHFKQDKWIQALLSKGYEPIFQILKTCKTSEERKWERHFIGIHKPKENKLKGLKESPIIEKEQLMKGIYFYHPDLETRIHWQFLKEHGYLTEHKRLVVKLEDNQLLSIRIDNKGYYFAYRNITGFEKIYIPKESKIYQRKRFPKLPDQLRELILDNFYLVKKNRRKLYQAPSS